jgi:hypothetical protein
MKTTMGDYVQDIGLLYLVIPIITIGYGFLLRGKQP